LSTKPADTGGTLKTQTLKTNPENKPCKHRQGTADGADAFMSCFFEVRTPKVVETTREFFGCGIVYIIIIIIHQYYIELIVTVIWRKHISDLVRKS
jgi:hypothetical protein